MSSTQAFSGEPWSVTSRTGVRFIQSLSLQDHRLRIVSIDAATRLHSHLPAGSQCTRRAIDPIGRYRCRRTTRYPIEKYIFGRQICTARRPYG